MKINTYIIITTTTTTTITTTTTTYYYLLLQVWWNALSKGSVPVVMGTKKEDYRKTLPPNSFIHIDDFQSPKSLAEYLM